MFWKMGNLTKKRLLHFLQQPQNATGAYFATVQMPVNTHVRRFTVSSLPKTVSLTKGYKFLSLENKIAYLTLRVSAAMVVSLIAFSSFTSLCLLIFFNTAFRQHILPIYNVIF